ncbi:hypothetical protein [Pedobacter ureilyticus]|uniref:Uncharacterized protein n=1 Tax=Pedobacter ureilyticus TaxID=1393051 RepID=A0ABW9J6H9_9SPHI|nr:hypothetical protein [Pedobacter helvus]
MVKQDVIAGRAGYWPLFSKPDSKDISILSGKAVDSRISVSITVIHFQII